jgi:hypothetical protein
MQSSEHKAHWEKWSSEMASDASPGGKIDVGPVQTLGARPGRAISKRSPQRSRVSDISKAFARKL